MGSMIRARNPQTLADAFSLCLSEQNIHYIRNKNFSTSNNNISFNKKLLPIKQTPFLNYDNNKFQRPYYNTYNRPLPNAHNTYYNHKPFNNAQNPPNYPQAPKPKIYQKPEPMDTTSNRNNYKQPTRFNNQPPNWQQHKQPQYQFKSYGPPRFQVEEIRNMEGDNPVSEDLPQSIDDQEYSPYFQNLDEYENYEPEIEINETVFHHPASVNQSDT